MPRLGHAKETLSAFDGPDLRGRDHAEIQWGYGQRGVATPERRGSLHRRGRGCVKARVTGENYRREMGRVGVDVSQTEQARNVMVKMRRDGADANGSR
jgi:hypothetical protein